MNNQIHPVVEELKFSSISKFVNWWLLLCTLQNGDALHTHIDMLSKPNW